MAQLNITLNQKDILQLFCNDRDSAFKSLLENNLNSILKDGISRTVTSRTLRVLRSTYGLQKRISGSPSEYPNGTMTLSVSQHRNVPFITMIFDEYCRSDSEATLFACVAEMIVNGISTRKIPQVMETLCGT